jgi:hypothetical protein
MRVAFYVALLFIWCPTVFAQEDWSKPLQKICKRNHFAFNPDFSDRDPLGNRVELDEKGRMIDVSKPHAGV